MAFSATDIMRRALYVLQDHDAVRWTAPEMRLWVNDALREIAVRKPTATAASVEIALQTGTWQQLPDAYQSLIEVTRNLATLDGDVARRGGGRVVTPVRRQDMDEALPGWQDAAVLPYSAVVQHYIEEPIDRRAFYVVPGNDGTGRVEAVVSRLPDEVAEPPFGSATDVQAYTAPLDMRDEYRGAVLDFVLYRAYSKDMQLAGAAARAAAHFQQFAEVLGTGQATETAHRAARRPG